VWVIVTWAFDRRSSFARGVEVVVANKNNLYDHASAHWPLLHPGDSWGPDCLSYHSFGCTQSKFGDWVWVGNLQCMKVQLHVLQKVQGACNMNLEWSFVESAKRRSQGGMRPQPLRDFRSLNSRSYNPAPPSFLSFPLSSVFTD